MTYLAALPKMIGLITLIVNLFIASTSHALSTDQNQPAVIDADEVEFDFRSGARTYKGNVHVTQGTLRITADKLLVSYKNDVLEKATAWGRPAHFRQRPDGKQQDVLGEGRRIILHGISNTLTLINRASLKQGTNTARGEKIIYNMSTDKMVVKSTPRAIKKPRPNPATAKDSDTKTTPTVETEKTGGRSRVIIIPRSKASR